MKYFVTNLVNKKLSTPYHRIFKKNETKKLIPFNKPSRLKFKMKPSKSKLSDKSHKTLQSQSSNSILLKKEKKMKSVKSVLGTHSPQSDSFHLL